MVLFSFRVVFVYVEGPAVVIREYSGTVPACLTAWAGTCTVQVRGHIPIEKGPRRAVNHLFP